MKNIFAGKSVKSLLDQKGFTLVEMLVVVAIIAILASVFLVGLSGFRQSAYDARRLSDIQNVQTYLERYYNMNQSYPTSTSWVDLNTALHVAQILSASQNLPVDPAGGNLGNPDYGYCGITGSNGTAQSYVIGVPLSKTASAWTQSQGVSGSFCNFTCFSGSKPTADGSYPNQLYCIQF